MTGLTLGATDLMGALFHIEALGTDSGTSWGNPTPTEAELASFLQYGSLVIDTGVENREVLVAVVITGTGLQLAQGEAALMAELGKRNRLTYQPSDLTAPPAVYKVIKSNLISNPDDLREVAANERLFSIRLVCDPYVYSATTTTIAAVAAPPATPTTTVVDNCTSITNWFATYSTGTGAPVSAGGVQQSGANVAYISGTGVDPTYLAFRREASFSVTSTPYIGVDWASTGIPGALLTAGLDSTSFSGQLVKVTEGPSPTAGYTRSLFMVPAGVTSVIRLYVGIQGPNYGADTTFSVDSIFRTDTVTALTGKQLLRTLPIGGSAPTIGSIAVEHATASLGDGCLLYTFDGAATNAAGYSPACRQYRSSGPTQNTDATAVSGYNVNLDTQELYDIPVRYLPDGQYVVWARLKSASAAPSLTLGKQLFQGAGAITAATFTSRAVPLGGSVWRTVPIGFLSLPEMATSPTGVQRIALQATNPSTDDVLCDEVWLMNMSIGRLTQFDCGSLTPAAGGNANRFWADSPSLQNDGLGAYFVGYAADRSDQFAAYQTMSEVGIHEFKPPFTKVFTVTPNAMAASVSFKFDAAWHSNPGA